MIRYYTLLSTRQENIFKNLDLGENVCRIKNNLLSEKLYNRAGHFYSSVFIFSRLKAPKNTELTRKNTQPYSTTSR